MADKKTEVVITVNSQQPKSAVRAMETELKRLTNTYNQLVAAGKAGTDRAKQIAHEMKELDALVKEGRANLDKIVSVTNNLSNSSLSQLNRALRQVKKEMGRVSTDSPKLDDLRQKYKAITNQIKILQGEYVNIGKHINNLSTRTDSWLQRAISQQKNHIASIGSQNAEYQKQVGILKTLQAEETRRAQAAATAKATAAYNTAVQTVSSGSASANALSEAKRALTTRRDSLSPATNSAEIERINQLLKECDLQMDAIAGKEQKQVLTTQQIEAEVQKLTGSLKNATPEQLRKGLEQCKQQLDKMATGDPGRQKWVTWAKQLQQALDGVDREAVSIDKVMKNLKSTPLETLKKAAKQLETEIAKMTRGTGDFAKKQKDLASIRAEIDRTTNSVKKQSSAWQTTLRNLMAYMGLFQLFSMIQQKLTAIIRLNLKFSDQLADIRKVSGLAMDDINRLSTNLAKLDTRTSIQELNDIAYAGAKLGVGKYGTEGLEQFVRAANQVNVALKEDLGADALTALSKITEVMGLIPKMGIEKSMLATGSAMFQLSATSTATSNNIVEFAKRLTGMARTAGITTDQLLALGSAADSMYLMPEVASTAFNKFISSLQTKHNLIEKELQIQPGTINQLYSAGRAVDAMVLIFEKMKEKGNMNALQGIFKDLGSDGARLVNVMVTMSKNVDMLKSHLETSKEAFEEATAVSNEYAIQQETANALMERAGNIWAKAFINPDGVDSVKEMAKAWYNLSKSMTSNSVSMGLMKGLIGLIIGEIRILIQLLPALLAGLMVKGVHATWMAIATSIGAAGDAAVVATFKTNGLVAAWKALNVAQRANVIGLVVALLGSLAIGLAGVISKGEKATQWMKGFNDTMSDFNREFAIGIDKLDRYKKAIEEAAKGTRQRTAAIRNFNKEFGQYLSKMLTEKSTANDLANAYKEVVKQMRAKIALQLRQKDIEKEYVPRVGWSADRLTKYDNASGGSAYNGTWLKAYVDDMRAAGKSLSQINTELAKKFGVGGKVAADAFKMRSRTSPTEWFDVDGFLQEMRTSGGAMDDPTAAMSARKNNTRQLTQAERMLYAANRYAAQVYSADNSMNRINKKWKPFDDDIASLDTGGESDDPGTLDNQAVDKEEARRRRAEEARRRKEEAARKKALREEMNEEQGKAKAIIDNVKNYYERQIAAVTELATQSGMDKQLQQNLTDGLTTRMNAALANVRQAIAGTENEWAAFRQTMINDLYEPLGDDGKNQSTELLDNIIHNDIEKLKQMITVLSKELGQNGSVLLDQIWRKATENELATAKQENKAYQQRQQLLLEKNYTGKVDADYENQMEQFGVAELSGEQIAQLMGWSQKGETEAIQNFVQERSQRWAEAFAMARQHIVDIMAVDAGSADAPDKVLTILFGKDYKTYLAGTGLSSLLDMSADQFQVFYQKLIEYSDSYTDAQRKAYEEAKRRADFVFNNRADVQKIDTSTTQLSDINSSQQRFNSDQNFTQQLGMSWNMDSDPEILRYRLLAERARLYYEEMQRLRDQDKISEQQLTDAKRQMMEAQNNMADKVAAKFNERVGLLQSFAEPMADFAEGVGYALGNMIVDTEESNIKMRDLFKTMLKAYVKMTLQLMAQDLTRRVTKQLYQRQEEADETLHQQTLLAIQQMYQAMMLTAQGTSDSMRLTQHAASNSAELTEEAGATTGKVGLGIAGGAAKIIGTLGFWGIPLIAVITALLMGLLSWAIDAALGGGSDSGSDSGPNVKLASSMLTYDSGNAQSFSSADGSVNRGSASVNNDTSPVLGDDGHVYQAKHVGKMETGLVRDPITTLVNGQPALVAERGPEMVIGRETTAAMMMARPDLLAEIVKFDRSRSGMTYRAYDSGNIADFAAGLPDGDTQPANGLTPEDVQGLRDAMTEFAAMMLVIQKKGLHVNKFGRGGVTQESADGADFMRRNSGDRLWRKKR